MNGSRARAREPRRGVPGDLTFSLLNYPFRWATRLGREFAVGSRRVR